MKKWMIYVLGVVTGIVLTIIISFCIVSLRSSDNSEGDDLETIVEDDGLTLFKEPGDIVNVKSFKVIQVIGEDAALAIGKSQYGYHGAAYLLTNDDDKYYYDEEIVNVPKSKIARQVGIYRYPNKDNMIKTVPVVLFMDK